jgi:ribosomal protein S18 acetylase RimI-like enzyme
VAGSQTIAPGNFELQPISYAEMDSVVALHQMALSNSLNSRLGTGHLSYLHSIMLEDATCLSIMAVLKGEVLGVVCASLDPETLTRQLLAGLPARRWVALLGRTVCEPTLLLEWLRSHNLSHPVIFQDAKVKPCLTVIAVSPAARRNGVGRALIGAVDDYMIRHGQSFYHLDTRIDNSMARTFYSRLGFIEWEERGRNVIFVRQL